MSTIRPPPSAADARGGATNRPSYAASRASRIAATVDGASRAATSSSEKSRVMTTMVQLEVDVSSSDGGRCHRAARRPSRVLPSALAAPRRPGRVVAYPVRPRRPVTALVPARRPGSLVRGDLMAWIVLVLSGLLETVWAIALDRSAGFSRPLPSLVFGVSLVASMAGLAYALRDIPVGTGYAVWVGIGRWAPLWSACSRCTSRPACPGSPACCWWSPAWSGSSCSTEPRKRPRRPVLWPAGSG